MKALARVENTRLMGFDVADHSKVKESIERVGYMHEIDIIRVWNGYVIQGEKRFKALKELGYESFICDVLVGPKAAIAALESTTHCAAAQGRISDKITFIRLMSK